MALTREYRKTVLERIRRDPDFAAALYAEAVSCLIEGERAECLSILRDLVHARISFPALAEKTGIDAKGLHRMLGANGNPTMKNLTTVVHAIERDLGITVRVQAEPAVRAKGRTARTGFALTSAPT